MKNIYKYISPFAIIFCAMAIIMVSCKDDETYGESPDLTYIKNIKILNGGLTGDSIIIGKVDEINKEITFPKLDKLTNLSNVRFSAELPTGANFDKETYNFTINVDDGETQSKQIISVVNGKRKREYNTTIRLKVPAFGADFSQVKKYDFSSYPDLSAANTRNLDMDTTHVLIVSRDPTGPHLLKISDLKTGTIAPIVLDLSGVTGGTFAYSSGHLSHGHIYIVNLAGVTGELSIYHWESPSAVPTKIFAGIANTFGVAAGRHGDDMSLDLNEDGDGYIFLGNNQSTTTSNGVLRIKVTAFTTLSEPTPLTMPAAGGMWSNYNLVDETTDEYVYTGPSGPIVLVGVGGNPIYKMADNGTTFTRASDAHIVSYNQKRYLGLTTGSPGGTGAENAMYIYDITKGATTKEALELFDAGSKPIEYRFGLSGGGNSSVYCANFAFAKAAKFLYALGGSPYGSGFVVLEIPIATDEDNFYDE
ncbi:MAG: DUF4623 domain-containing protein [Prevotellaceae bacterium]|jgi:hypothetical protein|nr:DUF4623 domain-containing protein [Prevotellaceae bacterium]